MYLGTYNSYEELVSEQGPGSINDSYLVEGDLYIWSENEQDWVNIGKIQGPKGDKGTVGPAGTAGPQGPMGPKGEDGAGINILGTYNTYDDLVKAYPTGNIGDNYLIGDDLYVWSDTVNDWINAGKVQGPAGAKGEKGEDGTKVNVLRKLFFL